MITRVFFLHVGFSRHFTRLRHTLKRVILCCYSLLFVVDIGGIFNRVLHCFGLFFYPGQFKSCFPHVTRNPVVSKTTGFSLYQQYTPNPYIIPYGFFEQYYLRLNILSLKRIASLNKVHKSSNPLQYNEKSPCQKMTWRLAFAPGR